MKIALALLYLAFTICEPAGAATGNPVDLQSRYGHYYATVLINEDGTAVESYEWSRTVLKEAALESAKRNQWNGINGVRLD
jgi:hypothetical protein